MVMQLILVEWITRCSYNVNKDTEVIDYEEVLSLALKENQN